ncbi:MAG: AI-2E family transporter [Xanthomonadales bacterium]|nr:AI-2E family transporter [Xanthomonadales bacterium]
MSAESRYLLLLVLLAGLGWLIWLLAPVITPFAISAGLAYLGDPLVDRLERLRLLRWQVSRTVGVVFVFLMMFAVFVLLLIIIIPLLRDQVERLAENAPAFFDWIVGTAVPWVQARLGLESVQIDSESVAGALKAYWKEASSTFLGVMGTVSRSSQAVATWLMNLVLIPVVTFYLLRDWDRLLAGIRTLLPRRAETVVTTLFREIDEVLGAFVRGQLIVMLALGLIYTVGLALVGLDLAFIIGLTAGLLSIVPYLGTLVGVVAALLAAVFQYHDLLHPALVLIVFAIGQTLEGMVLTPKLVGDRVGLHPVAVIFAVLAGGQLFGFLGVLLALPVAATLNVLVRHFDGRYRLSQLYGKPSAEE